MNIFNVKSLPIKEVLTNLGDAMGAQLLIDCDYYTLEIPKEFGNGQISGINFQSGLAWIRYDCKFWKDTEIRFNVNKVHPLKLLYNLSDAIVHRFANDVVTHSAQRYQSLILASAQQKGHILQFKAGQNIILNSIEIDRAIFKKYWLCDLNDIESSLRKPILDENAQEEFYFKGNYTLEIADAFHFINTLDQEKFLRKMFLASKTFEVLAQQMLDLSNNEQNGKFSHAEIQILQRAKQLLSENFLKFNTIASIASELKISEGSLHQLIKRKFSVTGKRFINDIRMDKIKDLLENTDLPIQDIAVLVGIDSKSYLSKIFKEKYDLTPNDFRKVLHQ